MYAALVRGVDSFVCSLWSALALTGQRGLTIWLNWNIIHDVIVCETQLFEAETQAQLFNNVPCVLQYFSQGHELIYRDNIIGKLNQWISSNWNLYHCCIKRILVDSRVRQVLDATWVPVDTETVLQGLWGFYYPTCSPWRLITGLGHCNLYLHNKWLTVILLYTANCTFFHIIHSLEQFR